MYQGLALDGFSFIFLNALFTSLYFHTLLIAISFWRIVFIGREVVHQFEILIR